MIMHKIKHYPNLIPLSITHMISPSSPVLNEDHETNMDWYNSHNDIFYRKSVFFKGPLLYQQSNIQDLIVLPQTLKSHLKRTQLALQSEGEDEIWPNFMLYSVEGLRRSERNKNPDENI